METAMPSDLTSAQSTAQHDINKQLQEAIMRISESVEAIRKANQEDKQNQAARLCTLEANINEALLTHRSTRRATPYAKTNSDVWTPNPTSSQDGPHKTKKPDDSPTIGLPWGQGEDGRTSDYISEL
ncbi:hypothetical protein HPB48_011147 [Haemaphysalis longicornis]|uniref:Uncharacterized protein n=1 Tax=Haemaphysalis longicornis TaxID=44386 RepID=A0A9J6FUR0_HAELO|nr:hypothetical protein HPB48_011147 [Haemaphysalis longicornis]